MTGTADSNIISSFLLIGKLKTVVNEVMYNLENHSSLYDVDEFIAVTEDCLRALKTVKVERRIETRRMNMSLRVQSVNITGAPATPPCREASEMPEEVCHSATPTTGQIPRNYKAALMRHKRVSPKHSPIRAEILTREDVETARHVSALRGEERQRQAEERRFDFLQEMKLKSGEADARGLRAKTRREEVENRQKAEAQDRMENGVRRAEEVRRQTREKAQRAHSRVEEVLLTKELRQQNKALLLDKKMNEVEHNQEQMREKMQKQAQDRQEAMRAAAERRQNLSHERLEKQQQREQHRQENLRKIDEQKKMEQELKQQKAREWEKKVHQHHVDVSAETEALCRKTEEKFQQSAQLLEEQREKRQQRQERQDQKVREARERRDRESEVQPTFEEMMPPLPAQEEEQLSSRITRLVATSARQGKVFSDTYQKMSASSTRDVNRSRLRPIFSRLSTAISTSSVVQCKAPLSDLANMDLGDVDYEFVRYVNAFETLNKLLGEALKVRDFAVLRQITELLESWLIDEKEGRENIMYFVKSGATVSLLICIREEARTLQLHSNCEGLRCMLELVGICLEQVCADSQTSAKLIPVRDQLRNEVEVTGVDRICLAAIQMCTAEEELQLAYTALCIIHTELSVVTRRKGDAPTQWFVLVSTSLFALLQNTLTPRGTPLQEGDPSLSCSRVLILFCLFRTLNTLARWQLTTFQELLHDGSTDVAAAAPMKKREVRTPRDVSSVITRTELFHILNGFFIYIHGHLDDLETIPPPADGSGDGGDEPKQADSSFEEALRFGITLSAFPGFPSYAAIQTDVSYQPKGVHYHLRASLHECLLFVGYLCFDDAPLQDMLAWGKGKPLLRNMVNVLPIPYFSIARHILFPTVLSAILQNSRNVIIVREEMSLEELHLFVSREYDLLTKKARAYAMEHHKQLVAHKMETDPRFSLMMKLQGKSWAEMDDGNEIQQTPRSTDTASTSPAVEKEMLCKGFRATSVNPSNFFKLERRLPISYWPGVLEQLEKIRQI